ncbi:hypothetical protein J6590_045575 [Homalodisca vitripennis]|nr:hypothetical protein J6590_045575 [Homalodisca vitripennis]
MKSRGNCLPPHKNAPHLAFLQTPADQMSLTMQAAPLSFLYAIYARGICQGWRTCPSCDLRSSPPHELCDITDATGWPSQTIESGSAKDALLAAFGDSPRSINSRFTGRNPARGSPVRAKDAPVTSITSTSRMFMWVHHQRRNGGSRPNP